MRKKPAFDTITFKEVPEPKGGWDSLKMEDSDETFGEYRKRVKPMILGVAATKRSKSKAYKRKR